MRAPRIATLIAATIAAPLVLAVAAPLALAKGESGGLVTLAAEYANDRSRTFELVPDAL